MKTLPEAVADFVKAQEPRADNDYGWLDKYDSLADEASALPLIGKYVTDMALRSPVRVQMPNLCANSRKR